MPSSPNRLKLRLNPAAEKEVRAGHPWVYDRSIRQQNRPGRTGEIAAVYDRRDRLLALGLFEADSPIRLRVLQTGTASPININWWQDRLEQAFARRSGLFDEQTTAYRLIHGESDGWPGLVLDRYGQTGVLKLYSAAWFTHLPALLPLFAPHFTTLVGRLSRRLQSADAPWADGQSLAGPEASGSTEFLENGLRFQADVRRGQKTGFFLDQRENRGLIEPLASGRRVLNTFSYSGAFSVYAARGGARSVTDVDVSPQALAAAREHFEMNRGAVGSCRHETVEADVFAWLEDQTAPQFEMIILDPPSMAKRQSERPAALRAYRRLAERALRCLRPGGILVAASCSAHVPVEEFFQVIRETLRKGGGAWTDLHVTEQPPDHPATFPEARYLKCLISSSSPK